MLSIEQCKEILYQSGEWSDADTRCALYVLTELLGDDFHKQCEICNVLPLNAPVKVEYEDADRIVNGFRNNIFQKTYNLYEERKDKDDPLDIACACYELASEYVRSCVELLEDRPQEPGIRRQQHCATLRMLYETLQRLLAAMRQEKNKTYSSEAVTQLRDALYSLGRIDHENFMTNLSKSN